MKKFAILLVIVGLGFLAVGGYQLFDTKMSQNKSLAEARSLLADKEMDTDAEENDDIDKTDMAQSFSPDQGDTVGLLNIPRLEAELPIIEGTHEDELKHGDRKSTRLNSSHVAISYAVFCLKKKKQIHGSERTASR